MQDFLNIPSDSHFPLQNLPYGVFSQGDGKKCIGVALGDEALNLSLLEREGLLDTNCFDSEDLRLFISQGRAYWLSAREKILQILQDRESPLHKFPQIAETALVSQKNIDVELPVSIGDYTDFYSSKEHARNVGSMFRGPENPLLPNWSHLPVAYHGRSSSIVVSGTPVRRPWGQLKEREDADPIFAPSKKLDFELEFGCIIGKDSELGEAIPIEEAHEYIFGFVIVNDWSARDIQKWEYVPLGPFLGKNFATSISPWIVTLDALKDFRCPGPTQEPEPLPYLQSKEEWNFDIELEVSFRTEESEKSTIISRVNTKELYWNICQQIAHHSSNGCRLRVGDLLASGTISGSEKESFGSLLELSWNGTEEIELSDGQKRTFLQDGDEISLSGFAQGDKYRIGFGEVSGKILPAKAGDSS